MTKQIRVLLLITLAIGPGHAMAQAMMWVQIEVNGEVITTGEGAGAVRGVNLEDFAETLSYSWGSEASLDQGSGLPSGKRRHYPFTIVKQLARSSVLLRQALDRSDDIGLELRLFAPDATGGLQEVWRVELTNGLAVGIRPLTDAATGQYLEEIQFIYASIEFTDVQTGTSVIIPYPDNS